MSKLKFTSDMFHYELGPIAEQAQRIYERWLEATGKVVYGYEARGHQRQWAWSSVNEGMYNQKQAILVCVEDVTGEECKHISVGYDLEDNIYKCHRCEIELKSTGWEEA